MLAFSLIPFAAQDEKSNPATRPSKIVGVKKWHGIFFALKSCYIMCLWKEGGDFQETKAK